MNSLWIVLKTTFMNDWGLNGFSRKVSSSKEKKKILTGLSALFIGMVAIAYMVTIYALLLADALEQGGFLELILVAGILISLVMTLFTSIYKAQGSLFASRDYDLLMSLPIKPSVILTSKLINLLLLNWVFTAFAVVPAGIIYFVKVGNLSGMYFVMLGISIFFIPLIPVIIASAAAVGVSYFASKFRHKNLTILVGTMLLMAAILVGTFKMQSLMEYIFVNASSIIEGLSKIYPPIAYLTNALIHISLLEFSKFILVSIGAFVVFVVLFSKVYTKINARLGETYKKADYKMTSLKTNTTLKALTHKEVKRYLATPIYVMNTAVGMIMSIIVAVATFFMDSETLAMYMDIPYASDLFPLMILALMIFCIGLSSTTPSSISLEGKNLWIIKSLPIREKDILLGKIFLNLLLTMPTALVVNILFFLGLKFNIIYLIWNVVISSVFCLFGAVAGLVINLYFPKMEWSTPTAVVKQSVSVMINMLLIFACIGLPIAAFILLKITNIQMFLVGILVVLMILLIGAWNILTHQGIQKFREL